MLRGATPLLATLWALGFGCSTRESRREAKRWCQEVADQRPALTGGFERALALQSQLSKLPVDSMRDLACREIAAALPYDAVYALERKAEAIRSGEPDESVRLELPVETDLATHSIEAYRSEIMSRCASGPDTDLVAAVENFRIRLDLVERTCERWSP